MMNVGLHHRALSELRGIGEAPSQLLSRPSEVTMLTDLPEQPSTPHQTEEVLDSPEEPSALDPTQVSHSNDANKERIVEFLRVSGPVQGRPNAVIGSLWAKVVSTIFSIVAGRSRE
jgi:hypothetical protein